MTDFRFPFDVVLIHGLNGLQWDWLDALFIAASDRIFGIGAAVTMGLWLLSVLKRKFIRPLLQVSIAMLVTDQVGHELLKPLFHRLRPCFALHDLRQLVEVGATSGSMPSLHSANSFTFAVALALCQRGTLRFTLPIAGLIAISRVGVGVHWPSDVLAGAIFGSLVGLLVHLIFERLSPGTQVVKP